MPDLSKVEIRIGTSGYSFEDWKDTFYPANIEKGKMLDHYVRFFQTVEINSTYYRIPHPAVMHNIVKKAPTGFDFMVKVPQTFTHRRTDIDRDVVAFAEAIKPMAESGKLAGLLAQFPYSFKFSDDALDYVCLCRQAVQPHLLYVEFRHDSWVNRKMYERLKAEQIGYVCVDEPNLNGLLNPDFFTTTQTGYLRLHGRNAEQWWKGGPLRYDYDYSEEELRQWRDKLSKAKSEMNKLYVYFNNCHEGQAAKNGRDFQQMIDQYLSEE